MMTSDARKRHTEVRATTLDECAALLADAVESHANQGLEDRGAGYLEGWNAATAFYAAAFTDTAARIRDLS